MPDSAISDIIAEYSCSGVFYGKMYNYAVQIHKCIYEAMMRLAWMKFITLIEINHNAKEHVAHSFLINIIKLRKVM